MQMANCWRQFCREMVTSPFISMHFSTHPIIHNHIKFSLISSILIKVIIPIYFSDSRYLFYICYNWFSFISYRSKSVFDIWICGFFFFWGSVIVKAIDILLDAADLYVIEQNLHVFLNLMLLLFFFYSFCDCKIMLILMLS